MKNSKSLLKNGAIVFILTTMGSFLNYLCQLLMGRLFSVENYGIINSIFSLILIVSVIGNTAFMLMSKKLSEKNTLSIYKSIVKMVNKLSLILLIILIILLPITRKVISPNYFILALTYIALITSIYPLVYQGVFGGLGNFVSLGLYTLIIPFIKTGFLLIVWFGNFSNNLEIILAITSLIIGNLISIFVGYIFAKVKINKNEKDKQTIMGDEYKPVIIVNILMMFLMNVDILYLSYYFDSKTLGLYSSVLIFGKMIYYVVTALVTVMLPIVSKNSNDSKYTQKILNQTIFYTLILTIVFMIPLNIFTKQILTIAFGNRYIDAIEYVKYASFISITYSLNVILLNYLVGLNKTDKLKKSLIVGCITVILNLIFLHDYKFICLIIVGIVNLCVFIYNLIQIKCFKKDLGGKII